VSVIRQFWTLSRDEWGVSKESPKLAVGIKIIGYGIWKQDNKGRREAGTENHRQKARGSRKKTIIKREIYKAITLQGPGREDGSFPLKINLGREKTGVVCLIPDRLGWGAGTLEEEKGD